MPVLIKSLSRNCNVSGKEVFLTREAFDAHVSNVNERNKVDHLRKIFNAIEMQPRFAATSIDHLASLLLHAYCDMMRVASKFPKDDALFAAAHGAVLEQLEITGTWGIICIGGMAPFNEVENPSKLFFNGELKATYAQDYDLDIFRQCFPYIQFGKVTSRVIEGKRTFFIDIVLYLDDFPEIYKKYQRMLDLSDDAMAFDDLVREKALDQSKSETQCKTLTSHLRDLIAQRRDLAEKMKALDENIRFAEKEVFERIEKIKSYVAAESPNIALQEYHKLDEIFNLGECGPYVPPARRIY